MNPHTSSGGPKSPTDEQPAAGAPGSQVGALVKEILTTPISTVVAFAVVIFAAGSVASISAVALAEISTGELAPITYALKLKPSGKVLPAQTYQTTILRKASNLTLSVTPHDFDPGSGKWNYKVNWKRMANRTGSICINGNIFKDSANGEGEAFTGFSLNPEATYRVVYSTGLNCRGLRVINRVFKTIPEEEQEEEDLEDNNAPNTYSESSYYSQSGYPSYGYSSVSVDTDPGSWSEGWIESVSYNPATPPRRVVVSAWAYDGGYNPQLSFQLRNTDTGAHYEPTSYASIGVLRTDIVNYLTSKLGRAPANANGMFSVTFDNLPVGNYQIHNARYNGKLFNVHGQVPQNIFFSY